jgi:hypothetical protein
MESLTVLSDTIGIKFKKASAESAVNQYITHQKATNVCAEGWGFSDIKEQYTPDFVEKAQKELSEAKTEKEKNRCLAEIRKFKRKLKFLGFGEREEADADGVVKNYKSANFYDEVLDGMVQMTSTKLVSNFVAWEKSVNEKEATMIGQNFWIEYRGQSKNKMNAFFSNNFHIEFAENE